MRVKLENDLNIHLPKYIHLHHIDCNRKNNHLDNLIFLRDGIHRFIHSMIFTKNELKTRRGLRKYLRSIGFLEKVDLVLRKGNKK